MIFLRRDFNVSDIMIYWVFSWFRFFLSHILTQEEYHIFMVVQQLIDCSGFLCVKVKLKFYL